MLHALCYHRVVAHPVVRDRWGLAVTKTCFEQQIQALSQRMPLLDLSRISLQEAMDSSDEYALITFDDIYHEVVTCALPVLESYDASALLFIAGSFLEQPRFWWDELEALFPDGDEKLRSDAIDSTWQLLRDLPLDEKLLALRHLERLLPSDALPSSCRPLSLAELRALTEHPCVWLGGHTMSHPWLPALDAVAMIAEIEDGTALIRQLTESQPLAFAYPFGAWNAEARQAVEASGYRVAFTTEPPPPHQFKQKVCDPLAFPRLLVHDWSPSELLSRLR